MKRIGLVVLAVVAIVTLVAPASASAQDKSKSVMAGLTFTMPGNVSVGFSGALDLPLNKQMGKADLSVLVGGFWIHSEHFNTLGGGGGVKFEVPMNDKARVFLMVIAAFLRDEFETGFAFAPGGGILYSLGEGLDLLAMVGIGRLQYDGGGHSGAQITVGINKRLGPKK